jgi:hypothetical protein
MARPGAAGHQPAADRHHLLLAAREIAGGALAPLAQRWEEVHHAVVGAPGRRGVAGSDGAGAQVLIYSQLGKEPPPFEHLGDAETVDARGVEAINALAIEGDGATGQRATVQAQEASNRT